MRFNTVRVRTYCVHQTKVACSLCAFCVKRVARKLFRRKRKLGTNFVRHIEFYKLRILYISLQKKRTRRGILLLYLCLKFVYNAEDTY